MSAARPVQHRHASLAWIVWPQSMLVKDFTSNIAKDFDRWSMDGQFRALRAMELQSLGHQRVPAMALESQDWD